MEPLCAESRRRIEFQQLFDPLRAETDFLFRLSRRAHFGSFTVFDFARRDFQQFASRRMAVLLYQSDAPVVEQGQRAGAASVGDDLANNPDPVLIKQTVAVNVEYG